MLIKKHNGIKMQTLIDDLTSKLKKISFIKTNKKSKEPRTEDVARLKSMIVDEKKDYEGRINLSEDNVKNIFLNALLERSKNLKVMALMTTKASKNKANKMFLINIALIHEELALEIGNELL
jgi:hypothetical protein